jgi:hypothetical protein
LTPEKVYAIRQKDLADNLAAGLKVSVRAAHRNQLYQAKRVNGITLFQQRQSEPLHAYRKNAWTDDQYNNSNEREFHKETESPTRYQFPPESFGQTNKPTPPPVQYDEDGNEIHLVSYIAKPKWQNYF